MPRNKERRCGHDGVGRYYTVTREKLRNLYGFCCFVANDSEDTDTEQVTEQQDDRDLPF